MFLAVDAGNSKITFGLFEKTCIQETRSFIYSKKINYIDLKNIIETKLSGFEINECMIASVVDELTESLRKSISEIFNISPIILSAEIDHGIEIKTAHPEKCGADRIANAYAVSKLYSKRPIIVVDSGSATTFDIVDKENNFLCGPIMPGLDMQLKSLGEKTSKLPALDLQKADDIINIISDNTEEAIYAGVIIAHSQAVQGLLNLCEQKLGEKAFLVGTGGNINLVCKYLNNRIIDKINPSLTLEGIRMIYDLNTSKNNQKF